MTILAVLQCCTYLKQTYSKRKTQIQPLTKDIKKRIVEDITNQYTESKLAEDVIVMLRIASFLDPRFKAKYLEQLGESELYNVKQRIVDECVSICNEGQQQGDTSHSHTTPMATSDLSPAPKKHNLGTLFKKHETKVREEQERASGDTTCVVDTEEQRRQQVNTEVQNYLSPSRLDFEEDPLQWWKAQPLN